MMMAMVVTGWGHLASFSLVSLSLFSLYRKFRFSAVPVFGLSLDFESESKF